MEENNNINNIPNEPVVPTNNVVEPNVQAVEQNQVPEPNIWDKINNLEERLVKLEKIEHRRKVKNIIVLSLYGVVIISIIVMVIVFYKKLKPYTDTVSDIRDYLGGYNTDYGLNDYTDFFSDFFNY